MRRAGSAGPPGALVATQAATLYLEPEISLLPPFLKLRAGASQDLPQGHCRIRGRLQPEIQTHVQTIQTICSRANRLRIRDDLDGNIRSQCDDTPNGNFGWQAAQVHPICRQLRLERRLEHWVRVCCRARRDRQPHPRQGLPSKSNEHRLLSTVRAQLGATAALQTSLTAHVCPRAGTARNCAGSRPDLRDSTASALGLAQVCTGTTVAVRIARFGLALGVLVCEETITRHCTARLRLKAQAGQPVPQCAHVRGDPHAPLLERQSLERGLKAAFAQVPAKKVHLVAQPALRVRHLRRHGER